MFQASPSGSLFCSSCGPWPCLASFRVAGPWRQFFARYIYDTWSKRLAAERKTAESEASTPTNIVLVFISTFDRICYIYSGSGTAQLLPWWRLEASALFLPSFFSQLCLLTPPVFGAIRSM